MPTAAATAARAACALRALPALPAMTSYTNHARLARLACGRRHLAGQAASSRRSRLVILAASVAVSAITLAAAVRIVHAEPSAAASDAAASGRLPKSPLQTLIDDARSHPGIWIWGSNGSALVDPSSSSSSAADPAVEAIPVASLSGQAFRDLALGDNHAAAINERGDLLLWGKQPAETAETAAPASSSLPAVILAGKDLTQVACTSRRVYAVSRSGSLFQIDRSNANKATHIRLPSDAAWGEKIVQVSSGSDHVVAVSNTGAVYTLMCSDNGNKYGQLGLGHKDSKAVSPSTLYRVAKLSGTRCNKAAAGRGHTIVGSTDGRVFAFGLNSVGQLGIGSSKTQTAVVPLEINTIWSAAGNPSDQARPLDAHCTRIAAGGDTTLFVIETPDATQVLACGNGQFGQLGNGAFLQAMHTPTKIKSLSNLCEYDEHRRRVVPIRVSKIAASDSHCAAVLENSTGSGRSAGSRGWFSWLSPSTAVSYGHDLLMWGMNTHLQLNRADGKRGNQPVPGYVLPIQYTSPSVLPAARSDSSEPDADPNMRLQLASAAPTAIGPFKKTHVTEQGIALGDGVSAVYTRIVT
ncbi:regulator of chromosome condensation 1/beta-lactamase-inhibitor protein II [Entophlyctis helioformis]|nr:regulator of chromosome condensation 1/beta-lactamase-inhibitor protein II [Entophlyctis helioformis]